MTLSNETLLRFCATESDVRHYLRTPFRQAGHIYATNGHLFVEIKDDGRELFEHPHLPIISRITDKLKAAEFLVIPELAAMVPCHTCCGVGAHALVDCPDCSGHGEFEHGIHTYECKRCDGDGIIGRYGEQTVCLACDGIGEVVNNNDDTCIGPAWFATRYLRFIVRVLPGPVTIAVSGKDAPAEFRFSGGRGVLMPVRK